MTRRSGRRRTAAVAASRSSKNDFNVLLRERRAHIDLVNDPDGLGGRMSGAWWHRSEIEEAEVGKGEGGVMYFCTRPP